MSLSVFETQFVVFVMYFNILCRYLHIR